MMTFAFLKYTNMIVFDSGLKIATLAALAVSVELESHFREVLLCASFFVFFVVRPLFLLSELRLVVKRSALLLFQDSQGPLLYDGLVFLGSEFCAGLWLVVPQTQFSYDAASPVLKSVYKLLKEVGNNSSVT